ncbi:MAG: hypothetical protein KC492_31835, partial [Myxococcales bacterium]|nr:hypothetical protein [Myxococcales bacterium]
LAGLGLAALAVTPLAEETEAARRRRGGRKKHRRNSRRKAKAKGKGGKGSPQGGSNGRGCHTPEPCPADVITHEAGFACEDNRCSCGGECCAKGYSCFIDEGHAEICCFDDRGATEVPADAKYAVCVPESDVCCNCHGGDCERPEGSITFTRYRRTPR